MPHDEEGMILKTLRFFESFSSLNSICNYFFDKCEKISWYSNSDQQYRLHEAKYLEESLKYHLQAT